MIFKYGSGNNISVNELIQYFIWNVKIERNIEKVKLHTQHYWMWPYRKIKNRLIIISFMNHRF